MLLTIYNLPSTTRYSDVKSLLHEKCGLTELILDNLVNEGKTKKVTVGLADEGDAAILVRKINGLYINGLQLYVEDKRKKKDSDQPYRSSASIQKEAHYQEAVVDPQHTMEGAMIANMQHPMMMNYNMMGMYMPMAATEQNVSYMAYGVPQVMPSAEFVSAAAVPNVRGFQGDGNVQGRAREGPQGHNRDRNRRPSPERPAEAFNRPSRWNEMSGPKDFPLRRENSPPRQTWVSSETNQAPRAPFRQPERHGPCDPKPYPPRQPEPEFRRTDAQWEGGPSRWDFAPDSRMRSNTEQEWANSGPNPVPIQSWEERNPSFEEPNRQWDDYSHMSNVDFSRPDGFRANEERFNKDYTQNHINEQDLHRREPDFRVNEPKFRGHEPEIRGHEPGFRGHEPELREHEPGFRGHEPELRGHEPGFRGHEPEFRGQGPSFRETERPERDYNDNRDRRPRKPDVARNNGNDTRDRNFAPNNRSKDRDRGESNIAPKSWSRDNRGERLEDHRPIQQGRSERPLIPSASTSQRGKERHNDSHSNPKRPYSDRDGAPINWKQVANDYPAVKKPKGPDGRDNIQAPRPKPPFKENLNMRPQSFKPGFVNRPPHLVNPPPPPKPVTMKTLINKDQTSRGQATAMLAKEIVPPSALADPENRIILKELKKCIKGRIDVMLGEELSTNFEDVVKRYRMQFSKNKDRELYKAMRENRVHGQGMTDKNSTAELNTKPVKNETEVTKAPVVKEESRGNESSQVQPPSVNVQAQQVNVEPSKNETKTSNRPLTDKQIISEQKKQRKLEYSKADLFKLDPILDEVLNEELDKLNEIFASECGSPTDDIDSTICSRITTHSADEFKKVLRLHLTKRILNVASGLPLRVFAEGGKLPTRTALKQYLHAYRIERLVLKKNKKGTMYVVNLSKYADYDYLCNMERDVIDGIPVVFRSMNLLGPVMKMSKNQIQQRRKDFIQKQMDSINPGDDIMGDTEEFSGDIDYTEDADYLRGADIDELNEEDLEDF